MSLEHSQFLDYEPDLPLDNPNLSLIDSEIYGCDLNDYSHNDLLFDNESLLLENDISKADYYLGSTSPSTVIALDAHSDENSQNSVDYLNDYFESSFTFKNDLKINDQNENGISSNSPKKRNQKNYTYWTDQETLDLINLVRKSSGQASFRQIARKYEEQNPNRSFSAICKKLINLARKGYIHEANCYYNWTDYENELLKSIIAYAPHQKPFEIIEAFQMQNNMVKRSQHSVYHQLRKIMNE